MCGSVPSVTTITLNCVRIDPHQTGSVSKGSDHLKLIKFWPSRTPEKGVCGGAKNFGSALLQPARSVCISLSAFFGHVQHETDDDWIKHCTTLETDGTGISGRIVLRMIQKVLPYVERMHGIGMNGD